VESSHEIDLTGPLCNQPLSLKTDTCAHENRQGCSSRLLRSTRHPRNPPPASPAAAA
jgi:hypothetical protein